MEFLRALDPDQKNHQVWNSEQWHAPVPTPLQVRQKYISLETKVLSPNKGEHA